MSTQEKIIEQIEKYQTIIIHRHQRPDPDAIGSQCGLATIIRDSFPDKTVYQVGSKANGLAWIASEQEVSDQAYQNALVIVVDTANTPRVDDTRYTKGKMMIKIDHHPNDDDFGDLTWVVPEASSTSELIFDLVDASNGKLRLLKDAARMLYAGIVGDTGRFMYDATTPHTMRVAAGLMETGFDAASVNRQLDDIEPAVARLSAYVWENMQITDNNAAYIVLTSDILKKFELGDAGTAGIVPLLGKVSTVKCWTIFVQQKDGSYRLRIRSKKAIINELAKQYGGGGHPLASGAVIKDDSQISEFVKKLDQIAASDTGESNDK
ncbi:bifunctional oligoribonuclease/PAP phosphatase NrnA [Ligilactobacillus pobuzihii]|uniref:DHH family phosphoesterase n=1 Tax=Ligilactobacillus pobuzihii TaxID=449659 RepID=UPI0019D13D3B|nr:bifunctional oligoribonuclease/PAP phosphatase NrnA [Ligilactobacillus pobuzihii]MBN7273646.1 bifunctional oligoribonuclease/PAP phosphatase NrnA [Ligilactobacillus pobuzihii]